jgi:hypothetical protein
VPCCAVLCRAVPCCACCGLLRAQGSSVGVQCVRFLAPEPGAVAGLMSRSKRAAPCRAQSMAAAHQRPLPSLFPVLTWLSLLLLPPLQVCA